MATATITFGTFANDAAAGDVPFSNTGNAATENGTSAAAPIDDLQTTQRFKFTNGSGGAAIADAATINTIAFRAKASANGGSGTVRFMECFLVKGGTSQTGATNHGNGTPGLTGTLAFHTLGGVDTFAVAMTGADVKASGFGGSIRFEDITGDEASNQINLDYLEAVVDYTNPTAGGGGLVGGGLAGGGGLVNGGLVTCS